VTVLLVSPPTGDMTQPYTALPALAGHLRARGIEILQRDFGIEHANYWAQAGRTAVLLQDLQDALLMDPRDGGWEDYVDLNVMAGLLTPHANDLAAELGRLRADNVVDDMAALSHLLRILASYQGLLSLTERRAFGEGSSFQELTVPEAMQALANPPRVHTDFLRDVAAPALTELRPEIVGISITYPRQLYPALLTCQLVRTILPGTRVVLGGAYLTTIAETFTGRPELNPLWDYVIVGEGETAFYELCHAVESGSTDVSGVPNLLFRREGRVISSTGHVDEDLNALETPDFAGLDLAAYFSPTPVFLLPVARGCYMRCTFCSISYATRKYRARQADLVVNDIKQLKAQHGVRHFNFSIDVMAPAHLAQMSEAFERAELDVVWDAEIRFDRALSQETISSMRRAGCRHLRFGLESAVDRIRERMDKRIDIARVREILGNCRDQDIKASAMIIIGFPGETREEAEETYQFLCDNNDKIRYFALHIYTVSRGSIIEQRAEDFGVRLHMRPDRMVQPSWDFDILEGLTTPQAQELAADFRNRLTEYYPLAEEGFSVGIGGAFTFLTSARWTFSQLLEFDRAAQAPDEHKHEVGQDCVPLLRHSMVSFQSPFLYDGTTVERVSESVRYLVTRRKSLIILRGPSAAVVGALDGTRSVGNVVDHLNQGDPEIRFDADEVTTFLQQLSEAGMIAWAE
jgi:anaerobic magnesium-protoporphyrin IX monomethyl ester cyclase